MNIKRNIIFALEGRNKNGVAITENVPIRTRVNFSGHRSILDKYKDMPF